MKKMRKLIPAFAMLMVAAIMMSTASYAWFSMSTTATAKGMQVKATASSSLIIAGDQTIGTLLNAGQEYEFPDFGSSNPIPTLTPVTYDRDANPATGTLYKPNSTEAIDPITGQLQTGNAATTVATNAGTDYVDYEVYVAASGTEPLAITNMTANVKIAEGTTLKYIHNAITIDFWTVTVNANGAEVADTKAFHDRTNLLAASGTTGSNVILTVTEIPQFDGAANANATGTDNVECLKIIMRVYFDGALVDDSTINTETCPDGKTYVRNLTAVLDAAGFTVSFTANKPSGTGNAGTQPG